MLWQGLVRRVVHFDMAGSSWHRLQRGCHVRCMVTTTCSPLFLMPLESHLPQLLVVAILGQLKPLACVSLGLSLLLGRRPTRYQAVRCTEAQLHKLIQCPFLLYAEYMGSGLKATPFLVRIMPIGCAIGVCHSLIAPQATFP